LIDEFTGIPRILEWGVEVPQGEWPGEGAAPSPENFLLNTIGYFDAFKHVYFLNHKPMGGVLTP